MKSLIFENGNQSLRVEFVTDLIGDNQRFTVSEIKGLDDIEVTEAGFLFKELAYSIPDFKAFATAKNLKLVVMDQDAQSTLVNIATAFAITNSTALQGGNENVEYAGDQLLTVGGFGASTFEVVSGDLPVGITLSASGALTGTPTTAGVANFSVEATDTVGNKVTKAFTITISA